MYRFAEHGGEVELELEGTTAGGVFEAAVEAFAELADPGGRAGAPRVHELEVPGRDLGLLLVDVLNELVYLGETARFVPERAERVELTGDGVALAVTGRSGEPRHLVKSVTLNRLEFVDRGGSWHGRVVLDV